MTDSIAFDRAAGYYDRTRGLPPEVQAQVAERLRRAVGERTANLEIGVGTGRIALPLRAAGVPLVGIDLSEPMMRRLVDNAGTGRPPFPLAVADATRLPFATGSLDSVLACHVLHLIPRWPECVREIRRLLRADGVFLLDLGGGPQGRWRQIFGRVAVAVGRPEPRVGLTDLEQLRALTTELGFAPEEKLEPVHLRTMRPLNDALDELGQRIHAWTWDVERAVMEKAVEHVRQWAESELGDLTQPEPVEVDIQWRAYHLRPPPPATP